jgi:uncharacterized membrane protein
MELGKPIRTMTRYFIILITTFTLLSLSPTAYGDAQHFKETPAQNNETNTSDQSATSPDEMNYSATEEADVDPTETIRYRSIKYAGKFHPVVIHFPIAFLLGAVFMQWVFVFTKKQRIPPIVTTMLWMGTLGAVFAASLGWAYAYDSVYFGEEDIELLEFHRWLGTGTAVIAVLTLALKRFLKKPLILAMLLSIVAALVGISAHYGGTLKYGTDYYSEF